MAKKKDAEPTTETVPEAPAEKMTQREAVEKALNAGKESPAEGVPYVLKEFDITLSNQAFSTIKSKIKNGGSTVKPAGKRGRPAGSSNAAANGTAASKPASSPATASAGSPAELAQAVKALVKQHGAVAIKQMVDVFVD